jgi:hypothetical protein
MHDTDLTTTTIIVGVEAGVVEVQSVADSAWREQKNALDLRCPYGIRTHSNSKTDSPYFRESSM